MSPTWSSVKPVDSSVILQMNYDGNGAGWGRLDHRALAANDSLITGFIY